ncbi:MAG: NADH-quinone oxidoreductase subunit N [Armatimonadetes bacterium]|nr:NADH-quinone oxidoreductase subunit N [Armatimonadota bacterium]
MIPSFTLNDLYTILPMLVVMITGMAALMVDLGLPRDRKSPVVVVSFIGLMISAWAAGWLWGQERAGFGGTIVADDFALAFQFILLIVAALSIALSERYVQTKGINYGEYYALMLFSTSGAMLMAASRELINIFIGLEILSIALYVLSGFARTEARSEEAAMKYFLLGAFSSGFFLYGIALIYGGTGTTRLDMLTRLSPPELASPFTVAGFALLIVGLGFKAAIVPFHSWTPDVYEGAPTSVTAFMSVGAKAGAFAAFIRVVSTLLPLSRDYPAVYGGFADALWILAVLTMIVGNVLAVVQSNIKRMLAYSSIAHAGYILVGLLAQNAEGHAGVLFYVLAYAFMNLGAFGILILLARRGAEPVTMDDLQGLAYRQPWVAGLMAVFMLSLGGIPPTVGFMGKFFLFIAAVHAQQYALAVIGLVASVIGVFYYLNVIVRMFFRPALREYPANVWRFAPLADGAIWVSAIATLVLGIYSAGVYNIATTGALALESPAASAPLTASAPAPVKRASVR